MGHNGDRVLCNVVKMGKQVLTKEMNMSKGQGCMLWVHITLTRDALGAKVIQRGDKLFPLLASPVVLGPKECIMIVPPLN